MKSDAIIGAVQSVTKKWAKQRKREEREASAALNRRYAMTRCYHTTLRDAAWRVMEDAYLKASGNGTLPAHARQIMYAARPSIQQIADREIGKGFDKYFTQTLLPDYIDEKGVDWNVVFDARGHFHEPHTKEQVALGTLQVRNYLRRVGEHKVGELDFGIIEERYPTLGPKNRFGAILFIEKEGFMPLFAAVKLAERYDLAIMSTKGMSTTAARELVDELAGDHDIPLLVLHDFDKSGFSIVGTLSRDTRRYMFTSNINVIDIGLRFGDIEGLETERVYTRDSDYAVRANLRENGATDEEIEFLLHSRVEINAFASDDLVAWLERKLEEHGVAKVIPDDDTLAVAYRRMRRQAVVQQHINDALEELGYDEDYDGDDDDDETPVPADLKARIAAEQKTTRTQTWDEVLREIVESDGEAETAGTADV